MCSKVAAKRTLRSAISSSFNALKPFGSHSLSILATHPLTSLSLVPLLDLLMTSLLSALCAFFIMKQLFKQQKTTSRKKLSSVFKVTNLHQENLLFTFTPTLYSKFCVLSIMWATHFFTKNHGLIKPFFNHATDCLHKRFSSSVFFSNIFTIFSIRIP